MKSKYENTGCEAHDDCTTCPFEECILTDGLRAQQKRNRIIGRIISLQKQGFNTKEIAEKMGKGIRTIQRHLKGIKNGPAPR